MDIVIADENGEGPKCGHFSIRGYVAEACKKDGKMCWPFSKVDSCNALEEQTYELPPLHVTEFRWWSCQSCVIGSGVIDAAKETEVLPDPIPNGLDLISHSHVDGFTSSTRDAPMGISGFSHAPKENISEGRKDEAWTNMNVNEAENRNLSLANGIEMEAATEKPKRVACPSKEHDNGVATANQTICTARNETPVVTEGVTTDCNETTSGFNSNKQGFSISARGTGASSKFVPDGKTRETVSFKQKGEKRKKKRMTSSSMELYLDINPGFNKKSIIKRKKILKETSDGGASTVNVDIDKSEEEEFQNEHEKSDGSLNRRKVQKIRTMVDILNSEASILRGKGIVIDLNHNPDSPTASKGIDEKDCSETKGKRKILQDENEGSLLKSDGMFSSGENKSKLPRLEDGRSAFVPWNGRLGFEIGRYDLHNTVPRVVSGTSMLEMGGGVSRFHSPEASSAIQNKEPPNTERHQRVSTCRTFEPTASDEMEILALLARNKQEKRLFYAERTVGNISDGYSSQASMGAFSLSPPNYMPFGANQPRFVGGSSNPNFLSQAPDLYPSGRFTPRERENNFLPQSVGQQMDLLANDIIPATDLLRLMDASACTSTTVNPDKRKVTEIPLLPYEGYLPQLPRLEFGQPKISGASMLPPTSNFFDKIPRVRYFGFASKGKSKRNSSEKLMSDAFKSQRIENSVPRCNPSKKLMSDALKPQLKEKVQRKKVHSRSRSVRADKCVSRESNSSKRRQIEERFSSVSGSLLFPTHRQAMGSDTRVELDLNNTYGTEICTLNRNPADFSLPVASNKYMIRYGAT